MSKSRLQIQYRRSFLTIVCSGQDQLSLIYPVTVVWFVELKVPVLNNSLEFSGIVVYCSVIKVLGAVSRQLY